MSIRRLLVVFAAVAAVLATATSCLISGQHTLVSITNAHNPANNLDIITFHFDQGAPTGSTARYVSSPPQQPSGKPVAVDGLAFVQVDLYTAVAHDERGAPTAQIAYYPRQTKNVIEVAQYEDFEGHVGYALGLLSRQSNVVYINRTASAVTVAVTAR